MITRPWPSAGWRPRGVTVLSHRGFLMLLHMPSHIFTRLGMWEESIAANRSSADASRAYAAMRHRDATEAEELHALDYMAYSYLQEGQDAKAKEIVDFAATVRKTNPELEFSGCLCSCRDPVALRA